MVNEENISLTERSEPVCNDCEANRFYSSPCYASDVNREYMGLATEDEILKFPDESPASVRHE